MLSLFLTYRLKSRRDALLVLPPQCHEPLRGLSGLHKVLLHQPHPVDDPLLPKGSEPATATAYVLQLFFEDLFSLEAACARQGGVDALTGRLDALLGPVESRSQQAMVVRRFPVGAERAGETAVVCTYLVAYYAGTAQKAHDAWLSEYVRGHVPLMTRMPGVREIEIYTRIDWLSGLALPRADAIQRNKVVFDDAPALQAALQSPVRAEMRADYLSLPDIGLASTHSAMRTERTALGQ